MTDSLSELVRITVLDYDATHFQEKIVEKISECFPFRDTETVTWINVDGLGNPKIIEDLGKCFTIHPLILEDIFNTGQRPKMEDQGQYIYLTLKMLTFLDDSKEIKIEHISMVIGHNFLISFQEDIGDIFDPVRERIRKDGRIRKLGPDYLGYALIDATVDNYFAGDGETRGTGRGPRGGTGSQPDTGLPPEDQPAEKGYDIPQEIRLAAPRDDQ